MSKKQTPKFATLSQAHNHVRAEQQAERDLTGRIADDQRSMVLTSIERTAIEDGKVLLSYGEVGLAEAVRQLEHFGVVYERLGGVAK